MLITGGARGIGAGHRPASSRRRGWVPVLADLDEEALAASAFETAVLDVRGDAAACERAVAEVVERHGARVISNLVHRN